MKSEEIEQFVYRFEDNFGIDGKLEKNFSEKFKILLKEKEIEVDEFTEETGLSEDIFENYCKGKGDPSLRSITAFCHAFEFDRNAFDSLLKAGGFLVNYRKKRDCAYAFLITDCADLSIEDCNKILKKIGLKEHELLPVPKKLK